MQWSAPSCPGFLIGDRLRGHHNWLGFVFDRSDAEKIVAALNASVRSPKGAAERVMAGSQPATRSGVGGPREVQE